MEDTKSKAEIMQADRMLFGSLLKYVVQSAPSEDPFDFVLAAIGQSVGADRCYVYRFWDPGKTSMCTNTHEWCAEGIKPAIGRQQACNLADLVDFNACIMSGRDFLFTGRNAIDAGSRKWLLSQGIKTLIATPLVGASGTVCGFAGFDFVKPPCEEFSDRIITNVHEAADILACCQRLNEGDLVLLDIAQGENEYEANERELERALNALQNDARKMHPKQMLEIVQNRLDADLCYMVQGIRPEGGGIVFPGHALIRGGWANTRNWTIDPELGRAFDMRLMSRSIVTFREGEIDRLKANIEQDESPAGFAKQLKVVHAVGVRHEGELVGVLCVGYVDDRQISTPLVDFLRRAALVIVSSLERIATYHDLTAALNIAHLKGDIVDYMFKHQGGKEIMDFIGEKVREITGAQRLMICSDDGSRKDWFGADAPPCCRECAHEAANVGRDLPPDFFSKGESVIVSEGTPLPGMNLPPYCPMKSAAICQFRKGDGWWRMAVDYTKPHKHNMAEVARGLHTALELLSIAYDRERHAAKIVRMQECQRFRADTLAYALSKDDLPGLIDLTLHRLLELTACDYVAIHSVDGDHRKLCSDGWQSDFPEHCEACSLFTLGVPSVATADHVIGLPDTRAKSVARISPNCPTESFEIVVVYCEGKPWGSIALHYLEKRREISEDNRSLLKIAADVLTLALERHSAAVRLKAERDRVVEAEKARSYFFSAVSHDIRTPLNAIIGFSELLKAGGVPPEEAKHDLKLIVSSGKMLLQLVNDVLDLSKMDLGKLEFSYEPTDIGEVVREMVLIFEQKAKERSQTIVAEVSDSRRFMVDPYRFRQVLFNFISNAVKYAGPCTIRVSVDYENGNMISTVADNGRGVSAEKAKRLMQPFVQADIKNRTEGSGLGLAICKRLVDLAHGKVLIETAPGKGFKIQTVVPVAIASDEKKDEQQVSQATASKALELPKRVLVVDDSPVNRAVLKTMLRKLGIASAEFAENGKVALEMLEKDSAFDLVMTDMWMPVLDGIGLVKGIRANERLAKLNVCLITADVEARTTCREQGFDAFLLKPVTIEALTALFCRTPDVRQKSPPGTGDARHVSSTAQ